MGVIGFLLSSSIEHIAAHRLYPFTQQILYANHDLERILLAELCGE